MKLDEFNLHITNHAYEQFCKRVKCIEYSELKQICKEQINSGRYHRKREYIHLGDIWWVFVITQNTIQFITCYGDNHIDLPKALKWAKRKGDRINLCHLDQNTHATGPPVKK